jgi:hypothetical protein
LLRGARQRLEASEGRRRVSQTVGGNGGSYRCWAGAVAVSISSAGASQQITAKALTDHGCDNTEWGFVITQIDTQSDAPASIHVTWANGQSEDVSLSAFTAGTAHYNTTATSTAP